MKPLFAPLLGVLLAALPFSGQADEWGWILSVPHAISAEGIYKVRILEIDGEAQQELIRYPATPGQHRVKVRMLLQVDWDPELADAPRGPGVKELQLEVEANRTYLLAAKLDAEAPIEAQLDRSYWQPLVYRVD